MSRIKLSISYWWKHSFVFQLLVISLLVFGSRSVIADWNYVPTGSMKPTILEGDAVFVNRLAYDLRVPFTTISLWQRGNPHRGDIVIFYSPADGTRLVKRVIGEPGDEVAMLQGQLFINREPVAYQVTGAADEGILTAPDISPHLVQDELLKDRKHKVMMPPQLAAAGDFPPIQVPQDAYFVLGDHRDNSADSRYIGFVPRQSIVGKAVGILVSLDQKNSYRPRWSRFFASLD